MYIAITGTPGTGKSTVAKLLRGSGMTTHSIYQTSKDNQFIEGYEEESSSHVIDINALDAFFSASKPKGNEFVYGHLAHLLTVPEVVIVLRCNPNVIQKRLGERGYPDDKIKENMEAEAVDVILVEALESHEAVYEIDTSQLSPEQMLSAVLDIVNGKYKNYEPGNVDWSEVVMEWY